MCSLRSVAQGHVQTTLGSAGKERMWQPILTASLEDISVGTTMIFGSMAILLSENVAKWYVVPGLVYLSAVSFHQ